MHVGWLGRHQLCDDDRKLVVGWGGRRDDLKTTMEISLLYSKNGLWKSSFLKRKTSGVSYWRVGGRKKSGESGFLDRFCIPRRKEEEFFTF